MKTIFVSGASGIVGYGTLKSLRSGDDTYRLIGSSIYDDSVAPAFCDIFELAPRTTDPAYIAWLTGIIKKYDVDMIFPGINDDMIAWNEHREALAATGTCVMLNTPALIDLCADKWDFYEVLRDAGMACAIESRLSGSFAELEAAFGLPFLLKPRRGFASKGIVIVDSAATFAAHQADLGDVVMAQPIVGDNESEYTISAFFDADSTLCCAMGLRRKLSKEGFTEKAEVAMPDGADDIMRQLADLLKPVGPTNFQFRVHDGQLKLLEINPRISSATSLRTGFGYNESDMAVRYFLDGVVPTQPPIRTGYAIRYTEDHLFYDSPTV
jgi:carbamoyl-phosphate synthase large subunit